MIPLVVRVLDEESGETEHFAFIRSPVRIGRGELNDLPLAKPFVSTWHGLVQFDDEGARYVDLRSKNKSYLEDVALEPNTPTDLPSGATIVIGTLRLTFSRRATGEQRAARPVTQFAIRAAPPVSRRPARATGSNAAPEAPRPPHPTRAPRSAPVPTPPPSPPEAPPVDLAAQSAAEAAIEAAALDLDLHYASYRGTFEHLFSAIQTVLASLEGPARAKAIERLGNRYAALRGEAQFASLSGASAAQADPAPSASTPPRFVPTATPEPVAGETLRLVRAFAESYLPQNVPVASAADVESLLGRIAEVLEAFARSFLELHRGYEEFGKETGVRAVQSEGVVHRARDARQLLAYLLDPRAQGRDSELQRAFADFMLSQVATLRGLEEGARALLRRLSPEAISQEAPQSVWPMRAAGLWKAYEKKFQELADEDDAVSKVLFGREFARAYASMVGRAGAEVEQDENEEDDTPGLDRPGHRDGMRGRR
jgi:type VI secretion system protein ImpI